MKNLVILFLLSLIMWGCSSSINTANMSSQERLIYAMKLYNDRDFEEAVNEFSGIVLQYPGASVVDTAQFYLGETRFQRKEYILAAYEYSKLIRNMPASKMVPNAQFMLAECYYKLSPDYSLDQKYTKSAIKEYQSYIDFFPTSEKVPDAEAKIKELNEKLALKEYHTAYIYSKLEYYKGALRYYNNVIEIYHDTKYAPLAMYDKVKLLISRDRSNDALEEINKFLQRYPQDERANEMQKLKSNLEIVSSK